MLAILGTMLLLILQAFVSIAIIVYFRQNHPGEVGIIPGLIAPVDRLYRPGLSRLSPGR